MLELSPETLAPKMMHVDSFINYLLKQLEQQISQIQMSYAQVLFSELLTQIIQNCG